MITNNFGVCKQKNKFSMNKIDLKDLTLDNYLHSEKNKT